MILGTYGTRDYVLILSAIAVLILLIHSDEIKLSKRKTKRERLKVD